MAKDANKLNRTSTTHAMRINAVKATKKARAR